MSSIANITAGLPVSKVRITEPGDDPVAYISAGLPAPESQAYSYPARNVVFANGVQTKLPSYGQYFVGNGLLSAGQAPYDWPTYKHQLHYRKTALALPRTDVVPAVARSFQPGEALYRGDVCGLTYPFTVALWAYYDGTGLTPWSQVDVSGPEYMNRLSILLFATTGNVTVRQRGTTSGSNYERVLSGVLNTDAWNLVMANFQSATSIYASCNGSAWNAYDSGGTNLNEANLDRTCIIYYQTTTPIQTGVVSHVAQWSARLTNDEISALYNNGLGLDPRAIRLESLVSYWPLTGNDNDIVGDYHLTAYGDPSWTTGPFELEQPASPIPYFTRRLTPSRRRTYIPLPTGGA